jgi:hypothetical protein
MVVVFESYQNFKNDAVRARMCKRLRSPGIDSLELVPGFLIRLQIWAQYSTDGRWKGDATVGAGGGEGVDNYFTIG